jgi:LacI family gluconate utilization system Gnt-I transcriptional repressor
LNDSRGKGTGRPVRLEDVAREAGVSPITVSRALSLPEKVRPETRQRVEEAVRRTGYVVNSIASSLRSGRSSIVTVFVASLLNPQFAAAIEGALDAFEGSRFRLMFQQTGYSETLSPEALASVVPFRPAGVMFTGVVRDPAARAALGRLGVPVVELGGETAEPIDMLVGSSAREGGRLMAQHLGARGFSAIAYCGQTVGRGAAQLEGFREGLGEQDRSPGLIVPMEGMGSVADGVAALDEIVARLPGCDAIFFGTDILALGALIGARRRGIDIPGRLAIAGFGDLDIAAEFEPGLTTVHVADYDMGRRAGEMLLQRLTGNAVAAPVIQVPPRLLVRGSTARDAAKN